MPYWVDKQKRYPAGYLDPHFIGQSLDYRLSKWIPDHNMDPFYTSDPLYFETIIALKKGYLIPFEYLGIARAVSRRVIRGHIEPEAERSATQELMDTFTLAKVKGEAIRRDAYWEATLETWEEFLKMPHHEHQFIKATKWNDHLGYHKHRWHIETYHCLLYTSDAADE